MPTATGVLILRPEILFVAEGESRAELFGGKMEGYSVRPIPKEETHEWFLHKHYAKRVPGVMTYSYGLYDGTNMLVGVCAFGLGARVMNNGYAPFGGEYSVETVELQRLCVNDGLPKNTLSFFVSSCLKQLPHPICVYSYADSNQNHHGYIYQATNWVYTGITAPRATFYDLQKKEFIHERTLVGLYGSSSRDKLPSHIEINKEAGGKHRYFMFLGTKLDVKKMKRAFKYTIVSYPKGDNKRYDSSYTPQKIQGILF